MSIINATNLRKTFKKIVALDDISLSVSGGQITGLVGPDGAGKTTLMRLFAGLMVKDSGTLEIFGYSLAKDTPKVQEDIGYMPQKFGLYEDLSVLENMKLYARLHLLDNNAAQKRIKELLKFTSLEKFQSFLASKLSGGMKQKLGLACTLLKKPKLLLLDEPGVGVDPISRRELWEMVRTLLEDDICIIWSTSYLDEASLFDHVILLNEGKILFDGKPKALTDTMTGRAFKIVGDIPDKRETLMLSLKYENVKDGVILGDKIKLICHDKDTLPPLDEIKAQGCHYEDADVTFEDGFLNILHVNFNGISKLAEQISEIKVESDYVIKATNITKKFGSFTATDNVNFKIKPGEIFGFLGPNGAGKSTTFKMLCGLIKPTSGTTEVLGYDLLNASIKAKMKIGYMSQKFSLYEDIAVIANLNFFAGIYGLKGKEKKQKVAAMLDIFSLQSYKNSPTKSLPLGYKQRLALACAVMHNPVVLFLDEPTSGVDPQTRREFWNHIYAMVQKGMTVMVTTHFMDEAEYCDRIALIYKAKVIALDTPHNLTLQVSKNATMEDAFIQLIKRDRRE